jgi:two-component system cell cycle sensor histidine kinase/response regulator CckA
MKDEPNNPGFARDPSLPAEWQALRRQAEEKIQTDALPIDADLETLSADEARHLLHELRVHQIELEMQNEELCRAQAELEASRARYFDLYDLAPVGYCTLSNEGLILEANLTAAALLGLARSALLKQPLTRYILPEDQDIYYFHRKQLFDSGKPQVCELRMVRQDGPDSHFWARLEAAVAQGDESGAPVCRAVISDITERQQAEEALRQLKEFNESIVQNVSEGIVMTDAQGIVTFVNPALAALLGYAPEELLGQPWRVMVPPDQQAIAQAADERRATGRVDRYELTLRRKDGSGLRGTAPEAVTVLVSGSPRFDAKTGQFCGTLAVFTDITDVKRLEEQVHQHERLAAVGQLAAGIAHDFNNVMAVVVLAGQILQKSPRLSDQDSLFLAMIRDRANHATRLIGQILDFGRRSYMERVPLDLLPLVKETIKLLERTLPENIRLELVHDRDAYLVNGDPTRLQQALMNLSINARDAMPGGGRLRFTFCSLVVKPGASPPLPDIVPGDWICLAVSDTGSGIAPQHLPHLFEPFFTTKGPDKGTGLGLSQVYGIVKQHEGSIDVRSQPGEGAIFSLYLPLLAIPAVEAAPLPVVEATPGGTETILLVEDEPTVRETVAAVLESLGYRVLAVASGAEALAVLKQGQTIDLMLSDMIMPGLSGLDLYRVLRKQQFALKGLIMTGYALGEDGYEELQRVGVDWIQKPFEVDDLAAKIRAALAGKVSPTQSIPVEKGR